MYTDFYQLVSHKFVIEPYGFSVTGHTSAPVRKIDCENLYFYRFYTFSFTTNCYNFTQYIVIIGNDRSCFTLGLDVYIAKSYSATEIDFNRKF